ncbi:MAG: molecular chaperone HtpG [Tissierellia bacterium]|nr:molecular chaperone HtpG [Tissierellia bacterium]
MEKRQFKAESKRLLDLVINSIYSNKEIFLRELISNASDALDKMYYKALRDKDIAFNKDDFYIKVSIDKDKRTLTVEDTGIGMTEEELDTNLGTIAKSGSFAFKQDNELSDEIDIIGQFGVGFYSAFMVADQVTVISKAHGSDKAYKWESRGVDGYTIEPAERKERGTTIILKLKENREDEDYDQYLDQYRIKALIKKHSDFIRYPIKMDMVSRKPIEGKEGEYEEVVEEKIINSMVPIWRKNKNELTEEDYKNFYAEKHFGFDEPLKHIHLSVDGTLRYDAILYIPKEAPYDFYTKEYEKGLELYSSGVLIMEKCPDLLPDYFSFVKGVVDSEDLSLNISREMLQHDRQLKLMANRIKDKIKDELSKMLKNERDKYEEFFKAFGQQLKYGIYANFGVNKDELKDLLIFYSAKEEKMITLKEYVDSMPKEQENIYYATGETIERLERLPQVNFVKEKGYDVLFFTDYIDEFAIKMLHEYEGKKFKSVLSSDLELGEEKEANEDYKEIFDYMKEHLKERVKAVKGTRKLQDHPVYLTSEGELSIEMEKVLSQMPDGAHIKADKVLEVNTNHKVFEKLKDAYEKDKDKFKLLTDLLYNQALLIEGLPLEDPVEFSNNIWQLL